MKKLLLEIDPVYLKTAIIILGFLTLRITGRAVAIKFLNKTHPFRKYLLIALLLPLGVVSCTSPLEKPFVIIDKTVNYPSKGETFYMYEDKNGERNSFTERIERYSIGDTIK